MPDREKVIQELESMRNYHRGIGNNITADIAEDALALIKEQEVAYQGAVELLRQKTILFDDAIKRLKEQEEDEPTFDDWTKGERR